MVLLSRKLCATFCLYYYIYMSLSFSRFLIPLHAHATAEKLSLKRASDYNYLKQSNCLKINGVDDSKKFTVLVVMLLENPNNFTNQSCDSILSYLLFILYFICRMHWIQFKYLRKTKWNYFLCLQLSCGWETYHSLWLIMKTMWKLSQTKVLTVVFFSLQIKGFL